MKTSLNLVVSKVIPNVRVLSSILVAAFLLVFVAACSSPPGTGLLEENDVGQADDDVGEQSCFEVCGDVNQDGVVNLSACQRHLWHPGFRSTASL